MGISTSKSTNSKEKRGTSFETTIVAEIISSKKKSTVNDNETEVDITPDLPTDLPPVKVLIHDRISSTAIDQLKDSEKLVNEIAKSLVLDVLTDEQTKFQFGKILKNILTYESVQTPTRDLIYWSIHTDATFKSLYPISKANFNQWFVSDYNKKYLTGICEYHLRNTAHEFLVPQISYILKDKDVVLDPLVGLATWLLKENEV